MDIGTSNSRTVPQGGSEPDSVEIDLVNQRKLDDMGYVYLDPGYYALIRNKEGFVTNMVKLNLTETEKSKFKELRDVMKVDVEEHFKIER